MNLKDITVEFVSDRDTHIRGLWASRNERMNDYEKLYLLDLWGKAAGPNERRISVPTCWTRVEAIRPLFLTKAPVISVPLVDVSADETAVADNIEKYLYGVWDQCSVMAELDLAEWSADCLGEGVLRCVYDKGTPEGEVPLLITQVDPRSVYATPGIRRDEDVELIHTYERSRRSIKEEWGSSKLKKGKPADNSSEAYQAWLDDEIDFVEYWRQDIVEVEEEVEPEKEDETQGPLARGAATALKWARDKLGGQAPEMEIAAEGPKTRKVKRRQIIHCAMADEEWIKAPVVMPGYNQIPFIRYPGISTPLPGENGALSVLFPLTGGNRKGDTIGVAGAEAEAIGMQQSIIERYASGTLLSSTDYDIDFGPNAQNAVMEDDRVEFLLPPGPAPAVDRHMANLQEYIQDATISDALMGKGQGAASGLALSAQTNPVMMRIASRQTIRERAYQRLNSLILSLTEQYAPDEGWEVWGTGSMGRAVGAQLPPADIQGNYRNRVELTASLPKDDAGQVMLWAQLADKGLISKETFMDLFQRTTRYSSQSPTDEMKRILRDKILTEGALAETLAKKILAESDPTLAAFLLGEMGQGPMGGNPQGPQGPASPQGPPGMPPGPAPGPPQQGPMGGMPPGAVATGQLPPAPGLEAMMGMAGQPMPSLPQLPPQMGGDQQQ